MSDYIKEKIKEFEKILNTNANEPKYGKHWQMRQDYILQIELPRFLKSSLQEMEERAKRETIEDFKRKLNVFSPSEEKEVVRWKNTFVKGHLENMEEASKLSELLFPVEEEKKCICNDYDGKGKSACGIDCPIHCQPKKEKRGR